MPKAARANLGLYGALLLAAGGLYVVSCAPGLLWQDSGLIQYRLWRGDIEGALGLALSHPLFYILGIGVKAVAPWDVSYCANLMASLAAAIAVANVGLLIRICCGRVTPAVVGAVTLALAHTFWWHASVAETYTLWAALFTGELIALLQYDRTRQVSCLYLLGLLNGMALAVHMLASLPLACYLVMLVILTARRQIRARETLLVAALWVLGAGPYIYLVVCRMCDSGHILGTLASAAFGDRWRAEVLNVRLSWAMIKNDALLLALNCPSPNALLFFIGVAALGKKRATGIWPRIVLVVMGLYFLFAFRYTVSDRFGFFIPFYVMAAICVGLGADRVLERTRAKWPVALIVCCALAPVPVYAVLPKVTRQMHVSLGTRGDIPYRDDYAYFLQPWKTGYRGADRFANEALASVSADAVIYADTTTVGPLLYTQEAQGRRTDVQIVTGVAHRQDAPAYDVATFERLIESHPIYVTSARAGYCPSFIVDGPYELVRSGLLWRVSAP